MWAQLSPGEARKRLRVVGEEAREEVGRQQGALVSDVLVQLDYLGAIWNGAVSDVASR